MMHSLLIVLLDVIGRKLRFFHAPWIRRPVRVYLSEYCHDVWYGKARMVWQPEVENSLMIIFMFSRFDRILACDRATYRHLATTYR